MQLKPKLDRVLIKRETLQEKASLIHIPEKSDARERPARGTVVALGPTVGYVDEATGKLERGLAVGMKVIFGRHAGTEIEYDGEKFWLITDRDVLCEVAEEAA
jgi:chaperonin GroES